MNNYRCDDNFDKKLTASIVFVIVNTQMEGLFSTFSSHRCKVVLGIYFSDGCTRITTFPWM